VLSETTEGRSDVERQIERFYMEGRGNSEAGIVRIETKE
jgi:hypothetical protein